jgi:hypothetical protein
VSSEIPARHGLLLGTPSSPRPDPWRWADLAWRRGGGRLWTRAAGGSRRGAPPGDGARAGSTGDDDGMLAAAAACGWARPAREWAR